MVDPELLEIKFPRSLFSDLGHYATPAFNTIDNQVARARLWAKLSQTRILRREDRTVSAASF
jgi:hypothetical protein